MRGILCTGVMGLLLTACSHDVIDVLDPDNDTDTVKTFTLHIPDVDELTSSTNLLKSSARTQTGDVEMYFECGEFSFTEEYYSNNESGLYYVNALTDNDEIIGHRLYITFGVPSYVTGQISNIEVVSPDLGVIYTVDQLEGFNRHWFTVPEVSNAMYLKYETEYGTVLSDLATASPNGVSIEVCDYTPDCDLPEIQKLLKLLPDTFTVNFYEDETLVKSLTDLTAGDHTVEIRGGVYDIRIESQFSEKSGNSMIPEMTTLNLPLTGGDTAVDLASNNTVELDVYSEYAAIFTHKKELRAYTNNGSSIFPYFLYSEEGSAYDEFPLWSVDYGAYYLALLHSSATNPEMKIFSREQSNDPLLYQPENLKPHTLYKLRVCDVYEPSITWEQRELPEIHFTLTRQ
ncbi:hypothetical protein [Robertkochia solimangrovi]|uniref:hypothetical protein n=1 Tax=Robertkochia solimangrovi TaxID=2213046 RepID=UPI0011815AFD|nr:hypothetical protein [Robertkochia solimangrovi]TRZ44947.1 hypothetical protein DMZ48_04070 [Robertkochia solimangrovi]